jgi:hypothetical protein
MASLFNNPLFETIICLVLAFALLSLLASSILELLNTYFQERGKLLFNSISGMFADSSNVNFGQLLYSLPNINNLKKNRESLTQYISKEMFSTGIVDTVSNYARQYKYNPEVKAIALVADGLTLFGRFEKGVESMEHTPLKIQLLNMIERSGSPDDDNDKRLERLHYQLEGWFNDQMERTTGWYKSKIRWRLFYVGLLVAITLNVDSIHLFQSFYRTPALRSQLLPVAEQLAESYSALKADSSLTDLQRAYRSADTLKKIIGNRRVDSASIKVLDQVLVRLQTIDSISKKTDTLRVNLEKQIRSNAELIAGLGLPIGWLHTKAPLSWLYVPANADATDYFEKYQQFSLANLISYILGIVITAFSIQFGAPFWFDLLLKVVNIRRAGVKPNEPKS